MSTFLDIFIGKYYMEVDRSYGDLTNPFTIAQAYMNVVEVALSWFGIWLVSNTKTTI
jgi:hypothetical protein